MFSITVVHKNLIEHKTNHFYKNPKIDKKHLHGDIVGRIQAGSLIIMSLKHNTIRRILRPFRMLSLSKIQSTGQNQKLFHLKVIQNHRTVNLDMAIEVKSVPLEKD